MPVLDERPATRVITADPGAAGPTRRRRLVPRPAYAVLGVVLAVCALGVGLAAATGSGQATRLGAPHLPAGSGLAGASPGGVTGGVAGGSGGSRVVAGVPVGYPHTPAGAQSAAANYVVAYGSAAMYSPTRRRAIVDAIADPAVRREIAAQFAVAFGSTGQLFGLDPAGQAPAGLQFVCRALPIGVRLLGYARDGSTAQVAVWADGIVGLAGATSTRPVEDSYSTTTVTLRWAAGDWKWVSFTTADGPTPVSGGQPASPAGTIASAVRTFAGLRYVR